MSTDQTKDETDRLRDEVVRRMASTPPQPKDKPAPSPQGDNSQKG